MGNRVVYLPAYEAEVEYLECTGTQWIDTEIVPDENCGVEVSIVTTINDQNKSVFGCETTSEYAYKRYHITPNLDKWWFGNNDIESSSGTYDTTIGTEYVIKYNINGEVVINNSKLADISVVNVTDIQPLCIAKRGPDSRDMTSYGIYKYKYFKIYSGSTLVRDFVPVRIGTTGYMYDKVSRQLFANAGTGRFVLGNDVANATVPQLRHVAYFGGQRCVGFEQVYEKCAWLKGRNGAYIDTNYIPLHSDSISCHYRYDGVMRNPDGQEQEIFGVYQVVSDGVIYRCRAYINGNNHLSVQFYLNINNFPSTGEHITNADITDLYIEGENFYFCVNGVQFSFPTNLDGVTMVFNKSIWLFGYNVGGTTAKSYFHGDISYFRITDTTSTINRVNMFPCRLLVDIPAILDGNGIARQAGTCGMWDTVSGRFFGNVAGRGTFDVVYLAEGVDYEVHDWLVGEINSVGTLQRLPINSSSMSYRVKRINGQNLHFFRTDGYDYYYRTENFHLGIYDLNQKTVIYNTSSIIDNEIDFECSAGNVSANGVDIPIYGFPIKEVRFHAADSGGMETYTSSITVDGIERYIPVKLLRPIPSKYDANGIARQAGECGMYDTVNDLFYGNVASSGVFSVSDD